MSNDNAPNTAQVSRNVALATLQGKYTTHGIEVSVDVSPCTWMYKGYGFQIGYEMAERRCWGHCIDKALTLETATRADVQRLLDQGLRSQPCSRCKTPFLFNATDHGSNRGTLCENCWMDDWKKDVAKIEEDDRKALARQDAKMIRKGMTHRVTAWVHPSRGDDRQIDLYTTGEPSKEEIAKYLRKAGSRVLDDYKVFPLKG